MSKAIRQQARRIRELITKMGEPRYVVVPRFASTDPDNLERRVLFVGFWQDHEKAQVLQRLASQEPGEPTKPQEEIAREPK